MAEPSGTKTAWETMMWGVEKSTSASRSGEWYMPLKTSISPASSWLRTSFHGPRSILMSSPMALATARIMSTLKPVGIPFSRYS